LPVTSQVKYRRLGDSDLNVSEICLGSWLTYGGSVERDQAESCVAAAFDSGINFIDTANVYAGGRAEEFLGDVLQSRHRNSYILATKVFGEMPDGDRGLSRAQIRKQIDASLARLRTDYIDLYQCQSYDSAVPLEETLDGLTEAVRAGKARYIGVSNWNGKQIRAAADLARKHGYVKIISSQPEYSLLHRNPERGVFPASAANGISQIVWSPLAQGVLTGKYTPGVGYQSGTRAEARSDGFMSRYLAKDVLERVQRLRPIADGLGITMGQLALAWVLGEPNLASAIVGASRPEQVAENAGASGLDLDAATRAAIEDAVRP
jgi:aryl-alcohol dehydrogenase-like predicted oxidoreductase